MEDRLEYSGNRLKRSMDSGKQSFNSVLAGLNSMDLPKEVKMEINDIFGKGKIAISGRNEGKIEDVIARLKLLRGAVEKNMNTGNSKNEDK